MSEYSTQSYQSSSLFIVSHTLLKAVFLLLNNLGMSLSYIVYSSCIVEGNDESKR